MKSSQKINPSINLLKILAVILMTVDHVGFFFFPENLVFRLIGRLSAPIFAYLIVQGIKQTKSVNKYLFRLLILAIISQLVFYATIGSDKLNVIFNFILIILFIKKTLLTRLLVVASFLVFNIEYGWFIFLFGLIFYYLKSSYLKIVLAITTGVAYGLMHFYETGGKILFYLTQTLAGFSSLIIIGIENSQTWLAKFRILNKPLPRWLFYIYYPANWLVLYLIWQIMLK